MRLAMTLLVRNEADIVAANIAFHLARGVDFVVVTDNGSTDGTRDILGELAGRHPIRIIDEAGDDYAQHRWVSRMASLARDEHGADWVLNNDADEFWLPAGGDLKADLDRATANMIMCARRNMMYPHDRPVDPPAWRDGIVYRVVHPVAMPVLADPLNDPLPVPFSFLDLPAKALCRAAGLELVHQGNHDATYKVPSKAASSTIAIYHYPIRSFEQFRRKIEIGGAAYARNTRLSPDVGWHWRRWHGMLDAGRAEEAYQETLPSRSRLEQDLGSGAVVVDRAMAGGVEGH
jgi:hypothetical protein